MKELIGNQMPNALEEAIRAMSKEELLNLVLKLAKEQTDFQRILLANVSIAPQIINKQPKDPILVKSFKKDISKFFNDVQRRSEYGDDYYHEYDENETYPELDSVFEKAQTLNPTDQIEVFWHVVSCGDSMFEEYPVGTLQIEKAIELYSQAVAKLAIKHEKKLNHFDLLLKACDWDMCGYGNIRRTIKYALDKISTCPEDYLYLVKEMEKGQQPEWGEWLADYYIKLGDDKNYLRIRHKHLESEDQYLDLANYSNRKGDKEKYLEILEQWVSTLPEKSQQSYFSYSFSHRPKPEGILAILANYYQGNMDEKNLCRVLMTKAQYGDYTLELYKQIKELSSRIKKWTLHQPLLIEYAKNRSEVLAKIYLYESNWEAAIKLANTLTYDENVKTLIAEGVKEHHPQDAISIYQHLVQSHIDRKKREHYSIAAQYAAKIKSIYLSIVQDKGLWQQYIDLIRKTYNRSPALKDEFSDL